MAAPSAASPLNRGFRVPFKADCGALRSPRDRKRGRGRPPHSGLGRLKGGVGGGRGRAGAASWQRGRWARPVQRRCRAAHSDWQGLTSHVGATECGRFMSAEAWAAIAGWVAAVVAIVSVMIQTRRARRAETVSLITHLEQEYESAEFRNIRAAAASYLHAHNSGGLPDSDEPGPILDLEEEQSAIRLLNFFEKVGFLLNQKVISAEALWHFFSYAVVPYWYASRLYVKEIQKDDPNQYTAFDSLYLAVLKVESAHSMGKQGKSWKEAHRIVQFLSEEARITLDVEGYRVT